MTECSDKRFKEMIHSYELGLLSEDVSKEFEQHMLVCDFCYKKVQEFQKIARQIRFNPRIHKEVNRLADTIPESDPAVSAGRRQRFVSQNFGKRFIPVVLIPVLFLVLLIMKPWNIEFYPSKEAMAIENRLAIVDFENDIDPDDELRAGKMIASLLISDLIDSRYIDVLSIQRIYDIRKLIAHEDTSADDDDISLEIASIARAQWLLTGTMLQADSDLIVNYKVVEMPTSKLITSGHIIADKDGDIFSLVDRISMQVKNSLPIPDNARLETDRQVTEITTHSTEAYRYYLEGLEALSQYDSDHAAICFENAIESDSTFAMAYYHLSRLKKLLGISRLMHTDYIGYAVKYAENTTWLEKKYIESQEALLSGDENRYVNTLLEIIEKYPEEKQAYSEIGLHYSLERDFDSAVYYLNKTVEIDPLYKDAYNQLAYLYDELGEQDKSIISINKYIELAPDEANPYDTRADLYARNGRLDKAIESYKKALEIQPNFSASLKKLGDLYLLDAELVKAESCYTEVAATIIDTSVYSIRAMYPSLIPYFKGQFNQAHKEFDDLLAFQKAHNAEAYSAMIYRMKAFIYLEQGDTQQALGNLEKSIELNSKIHPEDLLNDHHLLVQFLALNEEYDKAEQTMNRLKTNIDSMSFEFYAYWYALGALNMARSDVKDAIVAFRKALEINDDFPINYMLGRAYLEAGNYGQAISVFEKAVNSYNHIDQIFIGIWNIKMHYYLGLAYEKSNWRKKAVEEYEKFLEFWKDADSGLSEVTDAQSRIERLKYGY